MNLLVFVRTYPIYFEAPNIYTTSSTNTQFSAHKHLCSYWYRASHMRRFRFDVHISIAYFAALMRIYYLWIFCLSEACHDTNSLSFLYRVVKSGERKQFLPNLFDKMSLWFSISQQRFYWILCSFLLFFLFNVNFVYIVCVIFVWLL